MNEQANVSPAVIGAVTLLSCGSLAGVTIATIQTILSYKQFDIFLSLFAMFVFGGMGGLVGFIVGGLGGAVVNIFWPVFSNAAPVQISAPPLLAAIMTGVVKGGLVLGGIGFMLGLCAGLYVYQDLSQSYVRYPEAPDMALVALMFCTLPTFIIGTVGGAIWAVIRFIIK